MREKPDLPFYDGRPVPLGGRAWAVVLAGTAVAFAMLMVLLPLLPTAPLNFLPALLFTGLPLAALALVAGRHWRALFRPYGWRAAAQSLLFALLTIAVSFAVGLVLSRYMALAGNPAMLQLSTMGGADLALFLGRTFIQLIGEELLTILPLLAVLWFCVQLLGLTRRAGLLVAILASTLLFGAVHLRPTTGIRCSASSSSARRGWC